MCCREECRLYKEKCECYSKHRVGVIEKRVCVIYKCIGVTENSCVL